MFKKESSWNKEYFSIYSKDFFFSISLIHYNISSMYLLECTSVLRLRQIKMKSNIIAIIPFFICAFMSYNQIVLAQRNVLQKQSMYRFQNGNLILGVTKNRWKLKNTALEEREPLYLKLYKYSNNKKRKYGHVC